VSVALFTVPIVAVTAFISNTKNEKSYAIKKHGALTVRGLHVWTKLGHHEIQEALECLRAAGAVQEEVTSRAKKYTYLLMDDETEGAQV